MRSTPIPLETGDSEQFYTLVPAIKGLPESKTGTPETALRIVEDTLALALGRIGLLAPEVTPELFAELLQLEEQDGVVIVPDTNALHNGAVHWLLRVLRRPSVWLLPVVASLTTVQTRDAMVKGLVNKRKFSNLAGALRSRGLVNGALGLLQRNRGRCQVVEIDPSLLRYQKVGSSTGADPDQSDVLEDRLIIEAIHGVLRSMRSRTARRVITSDVNIARVLEAEGIETLFVPTIMLGSGPIECLRFDALARSFVGAPLRAPVWELAHAFSSIRLRGDGQVVAKLDCYWAAKTPAEWLAETLACEFPIGSQQTHADVRGEKADTGAEASSVAPEGAIETAASADADGGRGSPTGAAAPTSEDAKPPAIRQAPLGTAANGEPTARSAPRAPRTPKPPRVMEITTPLPRASFPQVLRLLASARRNARATAERIVEGLKEDAITVDNARRGLEILRRTRLVEQADATFQATPDADMVDAALAREDLDAVSLVMERFAPYRLFLERLRERGSIPRSEVIASVRERNGPVGTYESERLPRFHILLGQAWTRDDLIIDGSQRPTDRDAADAFEKAFAATASVGIASVADLLPRFCEMTRLSPWMAKRRIQKFVADRLLPDYSFQPAAGKKPVTRDEVVRGPLDSFIVDPVVVDRLHLGQRPVLTVEGPIR